MKFAYGEEGCVLHRWQNIYRISQVQRHADMYHVFFCKIKFGKKIVQLVNSLYGYVYLEDPLLQFVYLSYCKSRSSIYCGMRIDIVSSIKLLYDTNNLYLISYYERADIKD